LRFCVPLGAFAQYVGRNINMVSGTQLPDGDPFLQRQDEPSLSVSTRNLCTSLQVRTTIERSICPGCLTTKKPAMHGLASSVIRRRSDMAEHSRSGIPAGHIGRCGTNPKVSE